MKWKDVLIEQTETNLIWDNPITVLLNHDHEKVIGEAWMCQDGNQYIADLEPINMDIRGMYPSIGYVKEGEFLRVVNIGISQNINEDETIPPLGYGQGEL